MKFQQHFDVMWSVYDSFIHSLRIPTLSAFVRFVEHVFFFEIRVVFIQIAGAVLRGPGH